MLLPLLLPLLRPLFLVLNQVSTPTNVSWEPTTATKMPIVLTLQLDSHVLAGQVRVLMTRRQRKPQGDGICVREIAGLTCG